MSSFQEPDWLFSALFVSVLRRITAWRSRLSLKLRCTLGCSEVECNEKVIESVARQYWLVIIVNSASVWHTGGYGTSSAYSAAGYGGAGAYGGYGAPAAGGYGGGASAYGGGAYSGYGSGY